MAPQLHHLPHRHRFRGQHLSVDASTSRTPKSPRGNEINDSVDRLSDLPDTLLCHILSFLDTKYAVATSILSKRWKHLYVSVPNIVLDDSLTRKIKNDLSFTVFAMFGLKQLMLRTVPHINLFRLKCFFVFEHYHLIKTLVCAAIFRNVKEVDICICMGGDGNVSLPPQVFTSRSLVVLKLAGRYEFVPLVVPDKVSLPNLKVLHLDTLELGDSVDRLFQGCKLLEDLCLSSCIYDVDVLDFSFPFLRKLSIKKRDTYDGIHDTGLEIDAPNLEIFEYHAEMAHYLRMKKPMSNGRAKFDFWKAEYEDLLKFIVDLRGLMSLHLSELSDIDLQAMDPLCNCHQLSSFKVPAFQTLTRLELRASALDILPNILECAPQLEVLVLDKPSKSNKTTIRCPHLPEIVPICLTEHLMNVEFRFQLWSQGLLEGDFETMKYFLQNGKVLERMKISVTLRWWHEQQSSRNSIRRSVCEKLKMLPGFSKTCEVVIDY